MRGSFDSCRICMNQVSILVVSLILKNRHENSGACFHLLPLMHFLVIERGILLKENGAGDVWQEILPILGLMFVVMYHRIQM